MNPADLVNPALLSRWSGPAPRYTSYPTAMEFSSSYDEAQHRAAAGALPWRSPLSVYVHVPFCASPCFYCGCTRVITRQPAAAGQYLAQLQQEIELQAPLFNGLGAVSQLHFGGGTPTFLSSAQLGELLQTLHRHFTLDYSDSREFSIEVDPRTVTPEGMRELAALGFNRVSFGIQDFDPAVQHAVNRVQSEAQCRALIDAARDAGFRSVSVDLIYGLPLQTPASFARTLDQVIALHPDRIATYGYAHMPAAIKAQRRIRESELPDTRARIALLGLCIEKLSAAGYAYIGLDHFALPQDELAQAAALGELQRNFQGYSTRAGQALLGLGMSSISRLGDHYSQNHKQLAQYGEALARGHLPIERGLVLSHDDLLRREIIEALMCSGELDIAAFEHRHGLSFADTFRIPLASLQPMADDGLVQLQRERISVQPAGRLLLRSIARCFDLYRAEQAPSAMSRAV